MTLPSGPAPARDDTADACLAVVYCAGAGCRPTDIAPAHRGTGPAALRAAVRDRAHAVLVAAACLGRCQPGGTAAVGWAAVGDGRIRWSSPPVLVDGIEGAGSRSGGATDVCGRVGVLADWIRSGAPDPATLQGLTGVTAPSGHPDQGRRR